MLVSVSPIKILLSREDGWATLHITPLAINSLPHHPLPIPPLQIVVCDRIVPDLQLDLDDVDHNGKEPPLLEEPGVPLSQDFRKDNSHCMASHQDVQNDEVEWLSRLLHADEKRNAHIQYFTELLGGVCKSSCHLIFLMRR
jgi:hypothetical protein